ncbi:T9SS type A sorting domain-containing protein, partial [Bacteroidia bacterium]|nr:T9SS type A sorting domain-containing protein [Bacteroidia bacterium]
CTLASFSLMAQGNWKDNAGTPSNVKTSTTDPVGIGTAMPDGRMEITYCPTPTPSNGLVVTQDDCSGGAVRVGHDWGSGSFGFVDLDPNPGSGGSEVIVRATGIPWIFHNAVDHTMPIANLLSGHSSNTRPSMPLNHLFEMSNGQMELNPSLVDDLKYKIKKVILKVMPDMYFNQVASNGGKINTTQVFSYLLFDEDQGIDLIASHGEWLNESNRKSKAQQYLPYKLVLDNETVSTTSAYVNSVVGAEIRVNAQAIEVKNGLTVQAGYSLALNALDDITVSNTSVNPVVSFNIRDDFYGLGKITEATQSELDAFCSGINKEYRANQDASTPAQTIDKDIIRHETFAQKITVFPNPSSGVVQFEFLKPFGEGQFHLMDVNGRLIRSKKLSLELSQSHDLSYLSDGIYLLKITTDGETHAQKLMLHKH